MTTTPESEMRPVRKRSKRIRISLRALMLSVAATAIALAWYVSRVDMQRRAFNEFVKHGATVAFDFERNEKGLPIPDAKPSVPGWLLDLLDIHYFSSVVEVKFGNDSNLGSSKLLANLPSLKTVVVVRPKEPFPCGDLVACKSLEKLEIQSKEVKDIEALGSLDKLEFLMVFSESFTDVKHVAELPKLEYLFFQSVNVKDLTPLIKLSKLKVLNLIYMNGRDAEFETLTTQLPNCQVIRQDRQK